MKDDKEVWGKCSNCGEGITKRQYDRGNYNGHNGHEETHVRCRKGWQVRALKRIAEADIKRRFDK